MKSRTQEKPPGTWSRVCARPNRIVQPRQHAKCGRTKLRAPATVEDWHGDTYRAVYTVNLSAAVYVLHCFQKKATKGIATPKPDLDLIAARLKAAEAHARGQTP